jgi:hypothetical protein
LALTFLGLATVLLMPESQFAHASDEERQQMKEAKDALKDPRVLVPTLVKVPAMVLLVLAGVGYLLQKKWLGWMAGNLYAVLDAGSSIASAITVKSVELGGGFNLGMMAGILYPLFTLILINTTFRSDLRN